METMMMMIVMTWKPLWVLRTWHGNHGGGDGHDMETTKEVTDMTWKP